MTTEMEGLTSETSKKDTSDQLGELLSDQKLGTLNPELEKALNKLSEK